MSKIFVLMLAGILILSMITGLSFRLSSNANTSPSPIKHVILIMMENKWDGNIVGNTLAPYENYLIKNYTFAKDYYALTTGGLGDYIGITDGSSSSLLHQTKDCGPSSCNTPDTNIFSLLQSHGLTWKGYAESMPSNCYPKGYPEPVPDGSIGEYWPIHTAIPYYTDLSSSCSQNDVPLGNVTLKTGPFFDALKSNSLPNFAMVSPNVCDDMHTCPTGENAIAMGDAWLKAFVGDIISSSSFSSTVIFITFDNGPALSEPIPMIIVGPSNLIIYGTFSQKYTHYSTLGTIEDIFNLGNLGRGDKTATPMTAIIRSISTTTTTTSSTTSTTTTTTTNGPLAVDGYAKCKASGTSCSVSLSTTHSNDVIIVVTSQGGHTNANTPAASGLTFSNRVDYVTSDHEIEESYAIAPNPLSSTTITCAVSSGGANTECIAFGISGANTGSLFDLSSPATNSGNSAAPSVALSTSNAHDLILGLMVAGRNPSVSQSSGFNFIGAPETGGPVTAVEYMIVSTTESNLQVGMTLSAAHPWAMIGDAIESS